MEYTGTAFTYDSPNGISLHFQEAAECDIAIKISIKVVNDDYILPKGYEDMDLVSSMFKITPSADLPAPVSGGLKSLCQPAERFRDHLVIMHIQTM